MPVLTATSEIARVNDVAVNAAVVDLRSTVQRCVEQRQFYGKVIVEIDITGSKIQFHQVHTSKKTKHE